MGIQYLWKVGQSPKCIKNQSNSIPNCMQLIFQLSFSRPLFNECPNNLQLLNCTRFKTLRVMENEVASRVGNLMLNIMYVSLAKCCISNNNFMLLDSPQLMLNGVAVFYLKAQ